MGQLDLDYKPLELKLTLSTGAIADLTGDTAQEAIEAVDNLLSLIVMEHFEAILKTYNKTGEDLTVELIASEVQHLVENELSDDPEGVLFYILTTLALQRYLYLTDEVRKRQDEREKSVTSIADC